VADSYFRRLEEGRTWGHYLAGPSTVGPWAQDLQHGGTPAALAVAAAERVVQAETGRDDLIARRVAVDFVGPVPVGEVETRARVVRAARSASLAEVSLAAGGRDCLLVRVWFVCMRDTGSVAARLDDPVEVPGSGPGLDADFGYGDSLEWRFARGAMGVPGPGTAWVRPRIALMEGHRLSDLSRVALIADSASGISAELDWSVWSFVNVDLDVHLARSLHGEWVLMDAATQLGPDGCAVARSTLSDVRGVVGGGMQTLVLAPMRH
jgi:acyl-coenzyme A thioesterase PaaI-like protein